jgi:hypothetical protein
MKLLLIIYGGADRQWVPELLEQNGADGYTELRQVHGAGTTGRREGTRAWPGDAAIYFSIVPETRAAELTELLRTRAAGLPGAERLHVAVMPTETFF